MRESWEEKDAEKTTGLPQKERKEEISDNEVGRTKAKTDHGDMSRRDCLTTLHFPETQP